MDKNTWIGFLLIALIVIGFTKFAGPKKQVNQDDPSRQPKQELVADSTQHDAVVTVAEEQPVQPAEVKAEEKEPAQRESIFAQAAQGEEQFLTLENGRIRVTLSTLGGAVKRAELLEYKAAGDSVNPLRLFGPEETAFSLTLRTKQDGDIQTAGLYFTPVAVDSNKVTLRLLTADSAAWLDFRYELSDNYMLSFALMPHNMHNVLLENEPDIRLDWAQLIPQHEQGRKFEERYAQLQYMLYGGDMEKLSESKRDNDQSAGQVKWIAYKDQFFSTVLIADGMFGKSSEFLSIPMDRKTGYVKQYHTTTHVPLDIFDNAPTGFRFYFGPNHYNTLKAYDNGLESEDRLHLKELVPLGWKIVSWINKVIVIPLFDLFSGWGLHIGIVILLLTLVIKLIILPFVFVSYKSSAKMRVLRPQLDEINAKYPADKMQERQKATMELYRQAGVSPMSGCLPMLFQFPVLMAMFWFLPTAIELRGKSLFWADDLSTYDAVFHWSANIPLLGDHLSLFCLLMTICNIAYTYITMQSQNTDPNMKFMKYVMYAMPLMFLFIFNDYAAGLSFYYLVSLFITIFQTMIFRWTLNDKKMLAEMEENKKKKAGKPKSGFMERLEKMQREQQRMARENAKKNMRR